MQQVHIPVHLTDDVREIAEAHLERAQGDLLTIQASPGTNGEHMEHARDRVDRARQIVALFPPRDARAA